MTSRHAAANLIDEPRDFRLEELFFSTTDHKGRIQRANSVFCRIADYSWDDLSNKPHNVIRHPDMPRVVFKLLWDYIQDGRPIVAYVKNRARDGRYYWVVALVVAIPDGYLSVRFKPTSPLFATAKSLYAELRAVEASIEDASNDRKAAIAASSDALASKLQDLGFNGYDDFMQQVLKREIQSRETMLHGLASTTAEAGRKAAMEHAAAPASHSAVQALDRLLEVLGILFNDLESYVAINAGVRDKSQNVTEISESLRVLALNGALEADRLGANAAGLRSVLDWLKSVSLVIAKEGRLLSTGLLGLIQEIDRVVFSLGAAKLQIEMTAFFAHELSAHDRAAGWTSGTLAGEIECLHASSRDTVRRALDSLTAVRDRLEGLTQSQSKLLASSHSLRPIYLTGKIEMAGGAGNKLGRIFDDVSEQVNETVSNLNGLKSLLEELEAQLISGLAHARRVYETIAQIDSHLTAA